MSERREPETVECESGYKQRGESMLNVQWWQVILIVIAIVGVGFSWLLGHETRITKVESSTEYIVKSLDELKVTAADTNNAVRALERKR
jgi:hypothetical protein